MQRCHLESHSKRMNVLESRTLRTAAAQEGSDTQQLAQVARVRSLFGDIPLPEIEVFESPPEHYRMRCVGTLGLRIEHSAPETLHGVCCDMLCGVDASAARPRKDTCILLLCHMFDILSGRAQSILACVHSEQHTDRRQPQPVCYIPTAVRKWRRAEFRVWKDGDDMYYIMYEKVWGPEYGRRSKDLLALRWCSSHS